MRITNQTTSSIHFITLNTLEFEKEISFFFSFPFNFFLSIARKDIKEWIYHRRIEKDILYTSRVCTSKWTCRSTYHKNYIYLSIHLELHHCRSFFTAITLVEWLLPKWARQSKNYTYKIIPRSIGNWSDYPPRLKVMFIIGLLHHCHCFLFRSRG